VNAVVIIVIDTDIAFYCRVAFGTVDIVPDVTDIQSSNSSSN